MMLKRMVRSQGFDTISTLFVPKLSHSSSAHFVDSANANLASLPAPLPVPPPVRSRSHNAIHTSFFTVPAAIKSPLPDEIQSITEQLAKETLSPLASNWWIREDKAPAESEEMEVGLVLSRFFASLDLDLAHQKQRGPKDDSMYHCAGEAPTISLVNYYKRFEKGMHLNPLEGVFSLCLLNAFISGRRDVNFNIFSAHRLLAISIGTTTKFMQDEYYSNAHIAKISGVPLQEYNAMEVDLLASINFGLHNILSPDNYDRFLVGLKKHVSPVSSSVNSTETAVPTPSQQSRLLK